MQKEWVLKKLPSPDIVSSLSSTVNLEPALSTILAQRGISDFDRARTYFRPSLQNLHDPFLMDSMDLAVAAICKAMSKGEKILVYGDYDVDGTTAVALVFDFFSRYYPHLDYYVPDRYTEGYGLSAKAVDWAIANDFKLIITLDCGIKAIKLVQKGVKAGIDFVICDHHLPAAELPTATAILDPKKPGCHYPYKELSGCGIGFKLIQAYCRQRRIAPEVCYPYLDLVAVSIAADLVPITGENRILAYYGLRILNKKPRPGLAALIEVSGIHGKVDISEIVFGIAPRINAAGRIAHARTAVELLLADNQNTAIPWASQVNDENSTRKHMDTHITREALEMIEKDVSSSTSKTTVLYKKDWHKGVIGIVASRCIEKFYRPTIILTESQDKATGSARSVEGFDIYEAIASCSDLLDAYGGHKYAAGLTLSVDKVPQFQQRFEEVVSTTIAPELLVPLLEIDLELPLNQITPKFLKVLKQMGPFGPGNLAPVFLSRDIAAYSPPQILKDEHLKFTIKVAQGKYFCGVAFGMARYAERMKEGETFDLAYSIEWNQYRGAENLQLMVKDMKPHGASR